MALTFLEAPVRLRPPTQILTLVLHSRTLGLRGHFRRHMPWDVPRHWGCLQSVECQSEFLFWEMQQASTEASRWVIVWFCFIGPPSGMWRGAWQYPNILPSRENSKTSPTHLVLVDWKVLSILLESFVYLFLKKVCLPIFLESFVCLCFLVFT